MLTLLLLTNIAATIAFAISGALVAARRRLDIVKLVIYRNRSECNGYQTIYRVYCVSRAV